MIHSNNRFWDFTGGEFHLENEGMGCQAGTYTALMLMSLVSFTEVKNLFCTLLCLSSFIAVFVLPQASAVWR